MDYYQMMNENLKKRYEFEINQLIILFENYDFFDLCRSVYCINSFLPNRFHLELSLVLNFALALCSREGVNSINDFDNFRSFVESVSNIIQPSAMDDDVVTDNGEFKISFENNFYSVFLGNSFSFSFPVYQCIGTVSKKYHFNDKMKEILEFQDMEISEIKNHNPLSDYDFSKFNVPSFDYFQCIKKFYKEQKNELFSSLTIDSNLDVYRSHFINHNGTKLRIFNTSLVIDAFYMLLKENTVEAADSCFFDSLFKNFAYYGDSRDTLINVGIVENINSRTTIDNFRFKGAIFNRNTLVLFSNINDFNKTDLNEIKKKIENKIQSHELYIVEFAKDKSRVAHLDEIQNLLIVTYYPYFDITIPTIHAESNNGATEIGILDLSCLFYEAQSINDLIEFFSIYSRGDTDPVFCMFSGVVSKFTFWINNMKQISRGAINYNMIYQDVYTDEYIIFKKYKDLIQWFPFKNPAIIFLNPYRWVKHENRNGFVEISDKSLRGSLGGQIKLINNHYLFFVYNLDLIDEKNQDLLTLMQTIQDLNTVYANKIEDDLIKSGCLDFNIEILYLPLNHAKKVDNTGFTKSNNKYVYSDAMIYDKKLLIRYAINENKFITDMVEAKDNQVEIKFLLELFNCLKKIKSINFHLIENAINNLIGKKQIKLISKEIKYYKSASIYDLHISDIDLSRVDKLFAEQSLLVGIKPGKYEKKVFTNNVRELQKKIIPIFESEISKFNKVELHQTLLSILSSRVFEKSVDDDRAELSDSCDLDEKAGSVCKTNIIKSRTEHVSYIRFLNYLIDTNLSIDRESFIKPTSKDVEYLMAFAERLVLFQDSSDNAHYNLLPIELSVDSDYIPQVNYTKSSSDILKDRETRRFYIQSYLPSLDFDKEYLLKASESFKNDTGVSLIDIFNICEYLKFEFYYTFKNEIISNVFSVDYDQLICDIKQVYKNMTIESIKSVVDYLIIDSSKIKIVGIKKEEFVPLWEREKRIHRNETRPLFKSGNSVFFSPILINDFDDKWKRAVFNFYPLYEEGLDNTIKFLTEWKHECEKKMEKDIKALFDKDLAFQSVELYKVDKNGKHPNDLGDFDVLAIDINKKIIYNLEAKFLIFTGSIKENYNLQYSFFISDKRDEHFQKRIDYLSTCYKRILNILFSITDAEKYKLVNYMVTNKMFYCDIKKINFDIITFSEFKSIINQS